MSNSIITVENIKCGGCANSIKTKLSKLNDVENIDINIEQGTISFDHQDASTLDLIVTTLASMGYTQPGESGFTDKAKSYVSCMIGRMQKEPNMN